VKNVSTIAIAAGVTFAFLGTLTAILTYEHRTPATAPTPVVAGQQEMTERLDRLERAIIQLGARAKPEPPTGPAAEVITPPLPRPQDDARESAIRSGHEIVDRAIGATRWTIDGAAELAATGSLDGGARAGLFARMSAAINADPLKGDAAALRF
jgi:hypothetical protein